MDDLFVIIQTWDNVCGETIIDKDEDIPMLVSKTMRHAVCILILFFSSRVLKYLRSPFCL